MESAPFEKMLYDNAQLVSHASTVKPGRLRKGTLPGGGVPNPEFHRTEMTSPRAWLLTPPSTPIAAKERRENFIPGRKQDRLHPADERLSTVFCDFYQVKKVGNWERTDVLYRRENVEKTSAEHGTTE